MRIKEAAELSGVSVRTLRHYDEIGLLIPAEVSKAGYRDYSDENLETLQQILFFKELGFPLRKIKEIIEDPAFDRQEALQLQHKLLVEKRNRLDKMISMIEKTIRFGKGEIIMSNEEKFEGFKFDANPYEQEARERWGEKAVDEANEHLQKLSGDEKTALAEEMNRIYRELAGLRKLPPDSAEAQAAISKWYRYLNKHFGPYSPEVFKELGRLYIDDKRFTKNIDKFGDGLAAFMAEAMEKFSEKKA
ncbi:MerR family transcriptional regulator [Heyndrickxia acidiproducens]|uniref:MerR family transcriptional regulator n=1 Tax=Heyndrickxia acidiproducens TaxID=1121084 RepID=UPI00037E2967|nr:MerR family transcriptional regulator [Heyndrickxia acidiproducens]